MRYLITRQSLRPFILIGKQHKEKPENCEGAGATDKNNSETCAGLYWKSEDTEIKTIRNDS